MRSRGLPAVHRRLGRIEDVVQSFPTPNVLEVGCGFGHAMRDLAEFCPGAVITGMNLEPYEEQLPGQNYIYGDAAVEIPLPDDSVDFIYSIVAIYFFSDRARFIEEAFRVLRPGGQLRCNLVPLWPGLPSKYQNTDVIEGLDGVDTLQGLLLSLPRHRVTTEPAEVAPMTIVHKRPGDPPLRLGLVTVPEKTVDYGDVIGEKGEGFLRNWYRFSPADCTALSGS